MRTSDLRFCGVGVLRHYSNRLDLLEQLRKVDMILMDDGRNGEVGADAGITTHHTPRSRRLRDRFSSEDLQAMIDLYRSGTTAR
jgi:hypothetical protein